MSVWNQVSPSQIDNYEKCERSWYINSILRERAPQAQHQALGSAIHRITEQVPQGLTWDRSDVPAALPEQWDKAEKLAALLVAKLPKGPASPLSKHLKSIDPPKREWAINLDTFENGPLMRGYVDLALPPGYGWEALMIPPDPDLAVIVDYKTTSDWRYMKTPQELVDNVQMMTYGKWAISSPGLVPWNADPPTRVALVHLYALTKEPIRPTAVRDVVAYASADEINVKWSKTLDTVRAMSETARVGTWEDAKATGALTGHCEAYGGCPFRERCGIDKQSSIGKFFNTAKKPGETMSNGTGSSLLEKIAAKRAAAEAAAKAVASGEAPTPQVAPVPTGVVPHDAPPRDQVVITQPGEKPPLEVSPVVAAVDADDDEETDTAEPQGAAERAAAATNGTKRGRPSKAEQEAKFNAEVEKRVAERLAGGGDPELVDKLKKEIESWKLTAADAVTAKTKAERDVESLAAQVKLSDQLLKTAQMHARAPAAQPAGFTLYVDVLDTKGMPEGAVDFADWIQPIVDAVAEDNNVADWRMIPYTGKGVLASAIRAVVKDGGLPPAMSISLTHSAADVALEVLKPLARHVLRALRG